VVDVGAEFGAGAAGVALDPSGARAFVVNSDENTVSVVRTSDMVVVATIPVGSRPIGIAMNPDGSTPESRQVEIVTLRVRRIGKSPEITLPPLKASPIQRAGLPSAVTRSELLSRGATPGPLLLIDPESTAYIPTGWHAQARPIGAVILTRTNH